MLSSEKITHRRRECAPQTPVSSSRVFSHYAAHRLPDPAHLSRRAPLGTPSVIGRIAPQQKFTILPRPRPSSPSLQSIKEEASATESKRSSIAKATESKRSSPVNSPVFDITKSFAGESVRDSCSSTMAYFSAYDDARRDSAYEDSPSSQPSAGTVAFANILRP